MYLKIKKIIIFMCIIGTSFLSINHSVLAVNKSTAKGTEKRILLEAAHGLGGKGCNHASATVDGKKYYENEEARIMIDKIAGYLKQANIPYEIANEIAGDKYFNNYEDYKKSNCNPVDSSCCGFVQGMIGNYAPYTYEHVDTVGPDKYLFAFELHFNGGGGTYSACMVRNPEGTAKTNCDKITSAVDSVIGTTGSMTVNDYSLVGINLGTINQMQVKRGIPTYYLETLFMDNPNHMVAYVNSKDALARSIAQALIEIAGSSYVLTGSNNEGDTGFGDIPYDRELTGGSLQDFYRGVPLISAGNVMSCRAILVNKTTGELNSLGEFVEELFNLMKWLGPVLSIVLSIIDFIKTYLTKDNSGIKKAIQRTIKRMIIGIIIMFLPYLLDLLFHLFGLYDITRCQIGG